MALPQLMLMGSLLTHCHDPGMQVGGYGADAEWPLWLAGPVGLIESHAQGFRKAFSHAQGSWLPTAGRSLALVLWEG